MDGFDSNRGVIIMAATNRPETLDPALLRPGRFDRTVVVDRPDLPGREAILQVHMRNVKLADDVDLRHVASLTPGSVGADLANIVNEAALLAARKNRDVGDHGRLQRGDRARRDRPGTQEPHHDAGRKAARRLSRGRPCHGRVRAAEHPPRPQGDDHPARRLAAGYVLRRPEEDRHMHTRGELESDIKVALGGTMAEEIVYGEIANGATSDLQQCNGDRPRMVTDVRHEPAGPRLLPRR